MKHIYVIVRKESDTWMSTVEQWACSLLLLSQMRNLCRLHMPSWYSRRKDWKRDHLKTTQCSVNIGSLNWTTLPSASCQNKQNSLKLKSVQYCIGEWQVQRVFCCLRIWKRGWLAWVPSTKQQKISNVTCHSPTLKSDLIWNCARRLCLVMHASLSMTKVMLGKVCLVYVRQRFCLVRNLQIQRKN